MPEDSRRLEEHYKEVPKWAEDFSPHALKDRQVTRRDFIRFLFLVSLGFFTGTVGIFLQGLLRGSRRAEGVVPVRLFGRDEIAPGESRTFVIPDKRAPGIVVRLNDGRYVAYTQKCTHLQCPVLWNRKDGRFNCPCHNGAFSVETGAVLFGPPQRPLSPIELRVQKDGIYYAGVRE